MSAAPFAYSLRYAGITDQGLMRSSNQDELILAPEQALFGVSDGMGGVAFGDIAAKYVSQALPLMVGNMERELTESEDGEALADGLRRAVNTVSDALYENQNTHGTRCGATAAAVKLSGEQAYFLWLGDSRGYLLPKYKKTLRPMTKDMNLAGMMVELGELTRSEAKNSPLSSQLTAFVGMTSPAETAVNAVSVRRGDRLLLCSDGLYSMLEEREIVRILRSSRSPEKVCRRLVDAANGAGGRDNISAVYIRIV